MIRFVIQSFIFKRLLAATLVFILLILVGNKLFDDIWNSSSCIALTNMDDVYSPPSGYDNKTKIYVGLTDSNKICIEGNKKLRIAGSGKAFNYFDTTEIKFPKDTFFIENRIFLEFEASKYLDSVYIVVSKSEDKDKYFKQIFLSSVVVKGINEFSSNKEVFRGDPKKLVNPALLENNDTLINLSLDFFNRNKDTLKIGDCGRNSITFMKICNLYDLPCRLVYLQGGDLDISGYYDKVGYPSHMVCEVYSSKSGTWYVIDPTYGLRFMDKGTASYLNAAEISNNFFFMKEKQIVQDSIMFTKRSLVGRDYFKYYENVHYECDFRLNYLTIKILQRFYSSFTYYAYLYSNNMPSLKNGKNYLTFKSIMYLIILALHLNYSMFVITRRLMKVKKPQKILRS